MLLRAMVGIGEASCTTIAPTIISDLFVGAQRSKVVCVFYIFGPVGWLESPQLCVFISLLLHFLIH